VVTTSRIGVRRAPLAGQQWHTYTLTDFTRADVEQFVTSGPWAFTQHQGDTVPAVQAAAQNGATCCRPSSQPQRQRLAANPPAHHPGVDQAHGRDVAGAEGQAVRVVSQTLIESWNRARSLDRYPVGEVMRYEETVQVLGPMALWLRQENPTAGLVTQDQLEQWLSYYLGEWRLQRGTPARTGFQQRAAILNLPGAGQRQYGFLH
jgi:hypothetical protein